MNKKELKMIDDIKLQIKEQQQVLKDYQEWIEYYKRRLKYIKNYKKIIIKNIKKLNNWLEELQQIKGVKNE